ncbi:MAG: M14 family zinc carboxypeptidase [Bacteroidota bacterium]
MRDSTFASLLLGSLLFCVSPGTGQVPIAPVEAAGFSALTSYEELVGFVRTLGGRPGIRVQPIERSRQGREVFSVNLGPTIPSGGDSTRLRVLLFAQQHGDEPSGKEALTLFLARCASGEYDDQLQRVDIVVVPQMNPDGAELRQRLTADSIDLNRSHLLLNSPEVRGLHDLFLAWMPEVTVDIHEYSSFTDSWIQAGIIKTGDVQMGLLSNLNCSKAIRDYQKDLVLPFLSSYLDERGFSFHEYLVGTPPARIRYSTTEINDGRQSLGVFNTMSFIQEGRTWHTLEEQLERRTRSQLASLEGLIRFCADHSSEIRALVATERQMLSKSAGSSFAAIMDYAGNGRSPLIPALDLESNREIMWRVEPFHGTVRAIDSCNLPSAYVVPRELVGVLDLLRAHGVAMDTIRRMTQTPGEVFYIDSLTTEDLQDQPHLRVWGDGFVRRVVLRPGDIVVPVNQTRSLLVATLLEPESMWGLSRYGQFEHLFQGVHYPIMRLPVSR